MYLPSQRNRKESGRGERAKTAAFTAAGLTVAMGVGAFVASETGKDGSRGVARDIETMMSTHRTLSQAEWDNAVRKWHAAHTDAGDQESTWVQKKLMRESKRLGLLGEKKEIAVAAAEVPEIRISLPSAPVRVARPTETAAIRINLESEEDAPPAIPVPAETAREVPFVAPASFSFAGIFSGSRSVLAAASAKAAGRPEERESPKREKTDRTVANFSAMLRSEHKIRVEENGSAENGESI